VALAATQFRLLVRSDRYAIADNEIVLARLVEFLTEGESVSGAPPIGSDTQSEDRSGDTGGVVDREFHARIYADTVVIPVVTVVWARQLLVKQAA
jgi:hypothetical protein